MSRPRELSPSDKIRPLSAPGQKGVRTDKPRPPLSEIWGTRLPQRTKRTRVLGDHSLSARPCSQQGTRTTATKSPAALPPDHRGAADDATASGRSRFQHSGTCGPIRRSVQDSDQQRSKKGGLHFPERRRCCCPPMGLHDRACAVGEALRDL